MARYSGVLLASDYDGTLADDRGEIGARVRAAVGAFIAQGGYFTVCTGRTKQGFHACDPALINAPVLLANGTMAYRYDSGETVFSHSIPVGAAADVAALLLDAFPEISIEVYTDRFESFAFRPDARSRRHFAAQDIAWTELADPREIPAPAVKMMLSCGVETGRQVQRFLERRLPEGTRFIPSEGEFVEIISTDSDKGKGLLELARRLGVPPENVYAIGDGENDLDMLRAASVSFVPVNGCKKAKALGDVPVCSNNDGAVADALAWIMGRFS